MSRNISTAEESHRLSAQVRAAQRGNECAWTQLVMTWSPMLRRVAKGYRLSIHDVDDVVQITWLQAYRKLGTLKAPEALPGWLATIARRGALEKLQRGTREVITEEPPEPARSHHPSVEDTLIESEREIALHGAIVRLPRHQRLLLSAMLARPCEDYRSIAARLRVPIGSIGPTRARSVARLQRDPLLAQALAGGLDGSPAPAEVVRTQVERERPATRGVHDRSRSHPAWHVPSRREDAGGAAA
jgi:RNA polymerase sigma factor (sigma-70 family)